jgi:polysaccharide export outer membrane protein
MSTRLEQIWRGPLALLAVNLGIALTGCHAIDLYTSALPAPIPPEAAPPRELSMVSLPTYRIASPDVLQIELVKAVPRPPYRIGAYDILQIEVLGTMPGQPINGYFLVEGEGFITLGPAYGIVRVEGMTIDEATDTVTRYLHTRLQRPDVSIRLLRSAETEQIAGAYLVQPDGTVNLRRFGMVPVVGRTVTEVRLAVQQQLAQYFDSPQVAVDVKRFGSKRFYVITAGAGIGEDIQTFPITGNETVLDAISRLQGLKQFSSKTMWVARPTPAQTGDDNVLPVDYVGITQGQTDTNYQLLPGDRLFIVDDNLVAANNYLTKLTQPIERLLNISSQGTDTIRNMQTMGRTYNVTRRGI